MDKILAFSIMSSSPAEIAGAGYATRLSWRSGGAKKQEQEKEKAEQSSRPEKKPEVRAPAPRFAPEFDGLNCFESIIVSF